MSPNTTAKITKITGMIHTNDDDDDVFVDFSADFAYSPFVETSTHEPLLHALNIDIYLSETFCFHKIWFGE